MHHERFDPLFDKPRGQILSQRHTTMLAAGASHGDRDVPLAFTEVSVSHEVEQSRGAVEKLACSIDRENIVINGCIEPIERA